jgi:hypothetical protein
MRPFTGVVPPAPEIIVPRFDNGRWQFEEQMGGKEFVGFVYVIYDKVLNRAYLGKKLYRGHGQVNKGLESDWKRYKSTSGILKELWKAGRPLEEFEFICIEQYRTKGSLSYSETWSQCFVEAPTTKYFYNTRVEAVSWSVKEAITLRHKTHLIKLLERMNENRI